MLSVARALVAFKATRRWFLRPAEADIPRLGDQEKKAPQYRIARAQTSYHRLFPPGTDQLRFITHNHGFRFRYRSWRRRRRFPRTFLLLRAPRRSAKFAANTTALHLRRRKALHPSTRKYRQHMLTWCAFRDVLVLSLGAAPAAVSEPWARLSTRAASRAR